MSASKSVKFSMSLEKLSVTFEGDIQTAERLQGEIAGALHTLASAQSRMLGPAQKVTPAALVDAPGSRRRRRRRKSGGGGIDPAILDGTVASNRNSEGDTDNGNGAAPRARRPSVGATALLTTMKEEGFFGSKREIGEVRAALGKKGHTYKSNEISPTLTALTRDEILKREKNQKNHWVYFTE